MKTLVESASCYREIFSDARTGRCAHAMLVVFPDEALLRPLLRACARAFFLAEDGSRTAHLIEEEHFPDCVFAPAEGGKLTVENASDILEESALRPVEGEKKLFVLDNFHTVVPLVQNKLLKVFEEPPEGVYFLLGASNANAVLPTVRSRMKKLEVPPFSEEEIYSALCRLHPNENHLREAARASGGIYSFAERLLSGGGESFSLAERFLGGEAEAVSRELDKADKAAFFSAVRLVLYDMLLIATGKERFAARKSKETFRLAREYPAGAILSSLALTERAARELNFNANPAQCALNLAVGIRKEKKTWQKLSP